MINNTQAHDLIVEAEIAAFDLPGDKDEPDWEQLEAVEIREYIVSMLPQITVSPEVRAICEREMEEGSKSGWRINQ
jgi:hypothetical protein